MAEKPEWSDILEFKKKMEEMGFVPDRDITRFEKRGAYFTLDITIRRTTKSEFKDLDARVILTFVDGPSQAYPHVIEFKQCKALSIAYVRACLEQAQCMNTVINAMFNAIQNQASLIDPKEILKKENESKKEDA